MRRHIADAGKYDQDMRFVKGHGTENDFVVLPDPGGVLDLPPALVALVCDRRRGIGADGLLRVVRSKAEPESADLAGAAEWFMDYRNADGSLAEMCGNGIRVYGRYLVKEGLAAPGTLPVATRSGVKQLTVPADGDVSVDMGLPEVEGSGSTRIAGRSYEGLRISLGNPHLACVTADPIADVGLSAPPHVDTSVFPEGVNVELVRQVDDAHIEMRVYERGVGETRSCGSGAVAAAAAAARSVGTDTGTWRVNVPGGRLTVTLDGQTSFLAGPAVLVADGELRLT